MPDAFNKLLSGNIEYVEGINEQDPDFFHELAKSQTPDFLWIGCADSRVPESVVTQAKPGSIFVQRNIANLVIHSDMSLLGVAFYAVTQLKVKHIIICGHYGCGGVEAAMSHESFDLLDGWLLHIKDVYAKNRSELDLISDEKERFDRLVELNVAQQVRNMATVPFVQKAWSDGEFPYIHGWVYDLETGRIRNLGVTINSPEVLDRVYRYH